MAICKKNHKKPQNQQKKSKKQKIKKKITKPQNTLHAQPQLPQSLLAKKTSKARTRIQSTMSFSNKVTVVALQPMGRHETKLDLEKWWINLKIHLRGTQYKDVMLKTWTAKSSDSNRGFTESTIGSKTWTAEELSTLVGDMLETILSFIPEIAPSAVLNKATSLEWLFDHVRKHYGCERTGRDMMNRFETLERKPGEKMTAYWSRFAGFYEDNRIKKDDKLKTDGDKPTAKKRSADSA